MNGQKVYLLAKVGKVQNTENRHIRGKKQSERDRLLKQGMI